MKTDTLIRVGIPFSIDTKGFQFLWTQPMNEEMTEAHMAEMRGILDGHLINLWPGHKIIFHPKLMEVVKRNFTALKNNPDHILK